MKIRTWTFLLLSIGLASCQNEEAQRQSALRDAQKKEHIFDNIVKGWNFSTPNLNPKTQALIANWGELRVLMLELNQKPQSSIGAFQKKAQVLSAKANELNNNIPSVFNKPEIKSRIAVLTTKIQSIDLFVNLQDIPDQKVIAFVKDTNEELAALYRQMDEVVRRNEIPKETGEADMLRMLDTARAIPNTPNRAEPKLPKVKPSAVVPNALRPNVPLAQ